MRLDHFIRQARVGLPANLDDARHLTSFLQEYDDECPAGLVAHTGSQLEWLMSRVLAVPWWMLV